jgi:3-deoxy-D-arabino-heptulosonate 7-phosphate (DAHP) synthase
MYIQIINVKKNENKYLVGNIFKVKGEKASEDGFDCFTLENSRKIIDKNDCKVLSNVLQFKREQNRR